MANFVIIGTPNYATRRILHELKALRPNDNVGIVKPSNLFPQIGGNNSDKALTPKMDARFDDTHQTSYGEGISYKPLENVSCVIPRVGSNMPYVSKIINQFQLMGIPTTSDAQGLMNAHDKLLTFQKIEKNRLDSTPYFLPKTYSIDSNSSKKEYDKLIQHACNKIGSYPVVCKTNKGSQGKGVFLFESFLDAQIGIQQLLDNGHDVLLQQYIETGCRNLSNIPNVPRSDYRLVVVDSKVVATIKRIAPRDDFRTNASQRGTCEGIVLEEKYNQMAIDIANKTGLRCAGIDLAFEYEWNRKGRAFCYEANGNFNFEATEEFSNVNVAKKIAEYAIRIHKTVLKEDKPFDKNVFEQTDGIPFYNKNNPVYKEGEQDKDRTDFSDNDGYYLSAERYDFNKWRSMDFCDNFLRK